MATLNHGPERRKDLFYRLDLHSCEKYAATSPNFRNIAQINLVLVVFWITQRRRLSIDLVLLFAGIGTLQYPEAFGIGRHDAVLDTVVHHLDKVPGAVRTTV